MRRAEILPLPHGRAVCPLPIAVAATPLEYMVVVRGEDEGLHLVRVDGAGNGIHTTIDQSKASAVQIPTVPGEIALDLAAAGPGTRRLVRITCGE